MTEKQMITEIAYIKKLADGHKQMLEAMLQHNSHILSIIETYQVIARHRQLMEEQGRPKPAKLRILEGNKSLNL